MAIFSKVVSYLIRPVIENYFREINIQLNDIKILQAKNLIKENTAVKNINEAEFKVFSQWGDDGIIQYLISKIYITNQIFIEFGVADYKEANTRFLLENNNWRGLVIDSSASNISSIQKEDIYWKHNLKAKHSFVTAENINDLIMQEGITGNVGLMHIDVDGNDYWIWDAINVITPDIVSIEYNSLFGAERTITIPYQEKFVRNQAHFSNLYAGASLPALCYLAEKKGYFFVGCNSAGNDAYFVKKDKTQKIQITDLKSGYVKASFREARDKNGKLLFCTEGQANEIIKGLPVYNLLTQCIEPF